MMFLTNGQGWPSEFTRGRQIAEALGCKVNAPIRSLAEPIVAIKVLPSPDEAKHLKNLYLDMIDDHGVVRYAKRYPKARIIALTELMKADLESKLSNEIVHIPEHSCNFAQEKRTRKRVTVAGYVGSPDCLDIAPEVLAQILNAIGLKFHFLPCYDKLTTRKDVVQFYKEIDIQVCFRTPTHDKRPQRWRNPLKIFNAGSFGIPTVAYPEISYSLEAGTYFLEAIDLQSLGDKCWRLAHDKDLYRFYSDRVYEWSKQYDIEQIARLYAKLAPKESFQIKKNVEKMRKAS